MRRTAKCALLLRFGLCALGVILSALVAPSAAQAAQPDSNSGGTTYCNEFERIQSVIASEATRQPFDAQLEIARAMVTKGACEAGPDFLAGLRVARQAASRGNYQNHHARAYFNLYSFDAALRESWAQAAHIALTEQPRQIVRHFDAANAPRWAWWDDARACPSGDYVIGGIRFC